MLAALVLACAVLVVTSVLTFIAADKSNRRLLSTIGFIQLSLAIILYAVAIWASER